LTCNLRLRDSAATCLPHIRRSSNLWKTSGCQEPIVTNDQYKTLAIGIIPETKNDELNQLQAEAQVNTIQSILEMQDPPNAQQISRKNPLSDEATIINPEVQPIDREMTHAGRKQHISPTHCAMHQTMAQNTVKASRQERGPAVARASLVPTKRPVPTD
jgi:hypothetical protein